MIGGAVMGGGGARLGAHNAAPQEADDARPGTSRGLMADGIAAQIAELSDMARASGHKSPIRHVHASPPPGTDWGREEWDQYWALYEKAQGLEYSPFSEAIHDKPGADGRPPHRHRVYLAITARGTLVRQGWDYAKQEAVSRIAEHDTGQTFTKGKHNIRAATIAASLGREDVAQAMRAAGLLDGARAISDLTPRQRAQQERTHVSKADVARIVGHAWSVSDNARSFAACLAGDGLRLAMGDRAPVVIDRSGASHGLAQMLRMDARSRGEAGPRSAEVNARLAGADLPTVEQARISVRTIERFIIEADLPADRFAICKNGAMPCAPTTEISQRPAERVRESSSLRMAAGAGAGAVCPSPLEAASPSPIAGHAAEIIDGPPAAPGPGASPRELQDYRRGLMEWQQRKDAQAEAERKKQAQDSRGGSNGHGGTGGTAITIEGHHGGGWPEVAAVGEGRASGGGELWPSRESAVRHAAAHGGGERSALRSDGPADNHGRDAGQDGGTAFRDRVQAARAAAGLRSLKVAHLLDVLNPERPALAAVEQERARIAAARAAAPYADPASRDPEAMDRAATDRLRQDHAERVEAARAAREEVEAAWSATPFLLRPLTLLPWSKLGGRIRAQERRADHLDIAAEVGKPSRSDLAEAAAVAIQRAEHRQREHAAWAAGPGAELARRESFLTAVEERLAAGDRTLATTIRQHGLGRVLAVMMSGSEPDQVRVPVAPDPAPGRIISFPA